LENSGIKKLSYYIYFDDEFKEIKFGKKELKGNEINLEIKKFSLFYNSSSLKIYTSYLNSQTFWLYSSNNIIDLIDEIRSSIMDFAKNVDLENKMFKFYKKLISKYSKKYPEFFI